MPEADSGTDDVALDTGVPLTDGGDDVVTPGDVVAPTFAGITSAMAIEETKVAIAWAPASDDVSPVGRLAYRIYASAPGGGPVDFSAPVAASISGASSAKVLGLRAGQKYSFSVRAVDEAGNEDTNTKTADALTPDVTPPKFGGILSAKGAGANTLALSWNPASDNGSSPAQIFYRVYVSDTSGKYDFTSPVFATLPGTTSVLVGGLSEAKTYYAVVRAVDTSNNEDANLREATGTTLDKTPPTFAGLGSAVALGTSVTLTWAAATDNVDPASYITYDIYRAKGAGVTDFTTPIASVVGTTSYTFTGLDISTTYHFVVRARDTSTNRDGNTVDKSATTAASPDVTAPKFTGLLSATAKSASAIDLTWPAATDDYSPAASISYDIYVANSAGAETLTGVPSATVTGTTTYTLTGLKPNKAYFVVVRARDLAGNRDTNTVERTATTPFDTTRPTFAGLTSATALGPTQIQLSWAPATDDVSSSSAIVYRVFQATSAGAEVYGTPSFTTSAGVTTFVVNGLLPNRPYYFVVRAVDESGLADNNAIERTATTAKDTTPPTFGGLSSLTVLGPTSVVATWSAATDDVAPKSDILYDVFVASSSGGETYGVATYTSAPGATSYTIGGLKPKQTLFVVVRARDPYGNSDSNTIEKGATTSADTTPPVFGGAVNVSGATATTLTVNWSPATDDVTDQAHITYLICKSLLPTGCDGAGFFASASVTGATSYAFTGLTPLKDYYFRVRAQDEVPLIESNTVVVSGKTVTDTTKPTFGGCTSAVPAAGPAGAASLVVSWTAGTDDVSTPAQLVYDVWRSATTTFDLTKAPDYTSAAGATSISVDTLSPSTKYYFVCRARDAAGNRDLNTVQANGTTTADTTPPTFAGITAANPLSDTSVQLFWSAATDNATPQANIDYLICWWAPPATSCATSFTVKAIVTGTTSATAGSLVPSTTYSFMVRARDKATLVDTNIVSKNATTMVDMTDPLFTGSPTVNQILADTIASTHTLDISWTAASDASPLHYDMCAALCPTGSPDVAGYDSCAALGSSVKVSGVTVTHTTFSGLTAGTRYCVSVRAVDSAGRADGGVHYAIQSTATSYYEDIWTNIYNKSGGGGCLLCHAWDRLGDRPGGGTDTLGTTSPCGATYVNPGSANTSLIYLKMKGSPSCAGGARMPADGAYNSTYESWMQAWINEGAHNN